MAKKVTTILPAGIAVWPKLDQVDVSRPTRRADRAEPRSGASSLALSTMTQLPAMRRLPLDVPTVNGYRRTWLKRYASSRGIACNSWGYFPLTTAFLLVSASITAAALNNI